MLGLTYLLTSIILHYLCHYTLLKRSIIITCRCHEIVTLFLKEREAFFKDKDENIIQ